MSDDRDRDKKKNRDNVIPFRPRQTRERLAEPYLPEELYIADKIERIDQLPVIPELALRILKLRDDPDATVEQLVDIIMLDPSLAAQVIRYANSPLFGQRGHVKTLDDAIFRVLGFETVMYLAIGNSMAGAFRFPESGKLGLNHFWRSATYSAALMQNVAEQIKRDKKLQPGIAYLCGLTHNIGFLVLAQLFPENYHWLNNALNSHYGEPVIALEEELLGITHAHLGVRLMEEWQMPGELQAVAGHHHNLNYQGEFADYVWLTQITDQLLKRHELSDADSDELATMLYQQLGLSESDLNNALDDILQSADVLDTMVRSLIS
ncbi:HDOD domain-containing protein [Thiohalophilus sp.]|uniref:HDOD domain-containing protein n=1 Tax=Thiohalophilus sp. TaxID=3028392 RepID=UPI002ACE46DD|nr:HDOD domain-containing protein [Thiohalophilus sp.]MDZ7805412.1 HDOD domain-containing protein [Thiohalophilus sp.]